MKKPSGLTLILAATAVASIASFAVMVFVPGLVGLAAYKPFGLFWSAMYLMISALSGIQQEVTRGTVPGERPQHGRASPARNFGIVASVAVVVVIVSSAPLWVDSLFPEYGWGLVWPLAVACGSYVLVATLAGTLHGISRWMPLALMISVEAVLRLVAVLVLSAFSDDTVVLAWAAAIPFLLTIVLLWPAIRRAVVNRTTIDVGYRALTWNVARTVVASSSAGILVSGLPVVIGIASVGEPPATVAALFVAITLARAPVIVVVMSLQSYLVVTFRENRPRLRKTLLRLLTLTSGTGIVLSGAAWVVAPPVFDFIYSGSVQLEGWFYAVLVLSSTVVGLMCITAPAVLSLSQHVIYSAGWLAAAAATVLCFALPVDLVTRTVVAVLVGPVVGLIVHLAYLLTRGIDAFAGGEIDASSRGIGLPGARHD